MANIGIIGSGFSGLASASFMAKKGHGVTIFEKNESIGGRARQFSYSGFVYDMGPSWYWMPDVFDDFFSAFGKKTSDFYELVKLDPGFQIIFGKNDILKVPSNPDHLGEIFETIEKGSSVALKKYLKEAEFKYSIGMGSLIKKPAYSWLEYINAGTLNGVLKTNVFKSVSSYVRSHFKDERLIALMEFPVLFLGAMPDQIPALYSLMNYAALQQGTYYPMGGMYKIIEAMTELAQSLGVTIKTNSAVSNILIKDNRAVGLSINNHDIPFDAVIASADYHHVEQQLLPEKNKNYSEDYWQRKTFAPSSLIYYLGVNKKIPKLEHHNLFFDTDFSAHANAIYKDPKWPEKPLFYACCPSKTDPSVAPEGMENLFILIPIASGLNETEELRQKYLNDIITRMEEYCGATFKENIVYSKSYCIKDFITDYNAYKGNAYGLANTLKQTAVLKPKIRNKTVANLFYTGQLTVPGPGVPPALISGEIVSNELNKYLKKEKHESII